MKRLAWFTAVILATITAVLVLWVFREALVLFVFSLMIAAIIRPIIDWFQAHGLPRNLSLLFTYLAILAIVVVVIFTLGGTILGELQTIAHDLPNSYESIQSQWQNGNMLQKTIASDFQEFNNLFQKVTGSQWRLLAQSLMNATFWSLGLIGKLTIIFVLSIYWSADQEHFLRLWFSFLPLEWRTRSKSIWFNIERGIGSYLRSELIQSLLTVTLLGIGYQLIGLKYPVTLALIAAIGWLIIWFGGLIAVIPALVVGLSINPFIGIASALFTIMVLAFLKFFVEPKLFDRQQNSPLLVVIMVLITVEHYGMIGFIIAPPLAAAIQIVTRQLVHPVSATTLEISPPPSIQLDLLRKRLFSVQEKIAAQPEPPPPEIVSLVGRLDELIAMADQQEEITGG